MTAPLAAIVELVVRCCDPDEIILFGSRAKGGTHDGSDIDLLIVGDFKRPRYLRGWELEELLSQFPVAVDVHMVTRDELLAESADRFSFYDTIRTNGVTLHRKTGARSKTSCIRRPGSV